MQSVVGKVGLLSRHPVTWNRAPLSPAQSTGWGAGVLQRRHLRPPPRGLRVQPSTAETKAAASHPSPQSAISGPRSLSTEAWGPPREAPGVGVHLIAATTPDVDTATGTGSAALSGQAPQVQRSPPGARTWEPAQRENDRLQVHPSGHSDRAPERQPSAGLAVAFAFTLLLYFFPYEKSPGGL